MRSRARSKQRPSPCHHRSPSCRLHRQRRSDLRPPSRSTNCCPTAAVETKQEELPHLAKRFLRTTKSQSSLPLLHSQLNPPPIRTALRHKPTVATTNLQVMARSPVTAPSFSLIRLKGVPAVTWDQNPDIHNHVISFVNHQQRVQRRSRTRQLNVFRRRDSDYHRVLNHHGSQL